MIDSVKLSQLCEKATVGNILSDAAPELDPLAPVVAPVIETARLEAVRPGHVLRPVGHLPLRGGTGAVRHRQV